MMAIAVLLGMLLLPAWFFCGLDAHYQYAIPFLATAGWCCLCRNPKRLIRDGAFWCGYALILYLLVAYWNTPVAGRGLRFYLQEQTFRHAPPTLAWLPAGYERVEVLRYCLWFLHGWTCLMLVRGMSDQDRRRVFGAVTAHGVVLASVCLATVAAMTVGWMNKTTMLESYIGPFAYVNWAATYFVMLMCIAAMDRGWMWKVPLFYAVVLCSGCLAGIALGAGVLVWLACDKMSVRYNGQPWRAIAAVMILCAGILAWQDYSGSVKNAVASRAWQHSAAVRMMKYRPVLGAGPYGYKALAYFFTTPEKRQACMAERGRANCHNDYLQYASEFGVVGTVLLAGMVVCAARRVSWTWAAAGCALVGLHAMVDIPFRCPLILGTTLVGLQYKYKAQNKE